jgi:tRNA modification GTPase
MEKNSFIIAGVMTAKTVAGISSIQVLGEGAEEVLNRIFVSELHRIKPVTIDPRFRGDDRKLVQRTPPAIDKFVVGSILHGNIVEGEKIVDEVIIGCEGENSFSINCHGNPIIVENILGLLKKNGVKMAEANEILEFMAEKKYARNIIIVEAEVAAAKAATFDGAKIIKHQTQMGLLQTAEWLGKHINVLNIEDIKIGAEQILDDSEIASYFINGVKIVLAGPPNSGKSTLFNYLCGKEKAIVTDIAGTTRDWLSAKIRLKKIQAEIFDTAGIDDALSGKNIIDAESQKRAVELAAVADLVLYVTDGATNSIVPDYKTFRKKLIICINKSDLGTNVIGDGVRISAKTGSGVKELIDEIENILGVSEFDLKKTVCFTDRQRKIVRQIAIANHKEQIKEALGQLLQG